MASVIDIILKLLSKDGKRVSLLNGNGMPHENITMGEDVDIKLVRNGKVVKKIHKKGHTWTTTGLQQICKFMCGLTCYTPDYFNIKNNSTLVASVPITSKTFPSDTTQFNFKATYETTSTVSFTTIELINYASSTVFSSANIPGTKPADFKLEIEWNNSLSGV